jgi:biopolymer transport protein ExbD
MRRNLESEDFQMAPMIDLVFLLLVFFMCVSSLADQLQLIEADLPEAERFEKQLDSVETLTLTCMADGGFFWGSQSQSFSELKSTLRRQAQKDRTQRILVRAGRETEYRTVRRALGCLQSSGLDQISFAVFER